MTTLRDMVLRARTRIAYPALAVAMGLSTLVAGLSSSSFLVHATGTQEALSSPRADTAVLATPVAATSVVASASAPAATPPAKPVSAFDIGGKHAGVDKWVQRLTTSLRGDFTQSLTRMDQYAQMITAKLDAKQMPRELIYLALIESNFNPTAKSRVGAVGMWQFMKGTARDLGLTVRGRTDERKDPAQATDAALTYLGDLHEKFGSWYLAAAAYNSGAGTVSHVMNKVLGHTKGTDADFFRILPSLPRETQDYVPKLIASARVGEKLRGD
jgi:membrane-bound lytic murein transglycosylase D